MRKNMKYSIECFWLEKPVIGYNRDSEMRNVIDDGKRTERGILLKSCAEKYSTAGKIIKRQSLYFAPR